MGSIIASYVGYKPFSLAIDFSEIQNGFTQKIQLTIELEQEAKELHAIVVNADTLNWARNFNDFKKHFLGETHNSKKCRILNPKDIHFYFDPKDNVLVAHSKKPIEIENLTLGYKIYYYLYQFEVNFKTDLVYIFGVPRYEELVPSKDRQTKVWQREREKAYYGSVTHFMRALRDSSLKESGFVVKKIFTKLNPKRPPDEWLNKKIKQLRDNNKSNLIVISSDSNDSLSYYMKLRGLPKEIDSIAKKVYTGAEFFRSTAETLNDINGKYEVVFDSREEIEYLNIVRRKYTEKQKSVFHFLSNSLTIYANGYYEDVRSLFLEGYRSWHEKYSNILPLEYRPLLGK
ncbi:MAG: hypothetical protein ORN54_05170 [Cyclobacteriaceae bacterium]|nr:hypothetical protein [Cyclobacteriaceae bacterium]